MGGAHKQLESSVVPAIAMVIGIVELLNERYHKLSRLLTKKRLYRGFGALTWGGFWVVYCVLFLPD